jgi:hypothetical protein
VVFLSLSASKTTHIERMLDPKSATGRTCLLYFFPLRQMFSVLLKNHQLLLYVWFFCLALDQNASARRRMLAGLNVQNLSQKAHVRCTSFF